MLTFDGHCPHCHSDKGFNAFGISCYIIGDRDYEKFPLTEQEPLLHMAHEISRGAIGSNMDVQAAFSLAGECRKCHRPIVATCCALPPHLKDCLACLTEEKRTIGFEGRVDAIHPQPVPPYAHQSLPDKVREAFIDLQEMLTEKKQPHFIITGCRTVLEAAVRELGGGQEGDKLYARIEDLFAKGIITAPLKDWASIIRKSGNGAAHEMLGTPEEAREFVDFTKIFLQFTFELPATIRALKSCRKGDAMIVICKNCGREHLIKCGQLSWRCSFIDDLDPERKSYTHEARWEGCCECNDFDMEVTFRTEETPDKKLTPEAPEFIGCFPKNPQDNCVCPQPYDEDMENSYGFPFHGMRD